MKIRKSLYDWCLENDKKELLDEWDYQKNDITPKDITYGNSKIQVCWLCKKGHSFPSTANNRTSSHRSGCPYCNGKRIILGENDLASQCPEVAALWHPTKNGDLKPSDVAYGSPDKVWWICEKGHEWEASPTGRSTGSGCPVCSNNALLSGHNDLETVYPELAKEWNHEKNGDLKPSLVKARYYKEVWWKCDKGHEWKEAPYDRTRLGQIIPCKICRKLHPVYKGEKAIQNELQSYGIDFQREYIITRRGRYRDDFAILHKGSLLATIEYNGQQHYEPVDFSGKGPECAKKAFEATVRRDQKKREWLIQHGIPQLVVPYWDYAKIPDIISNFLKDLKLIA